MTITELVIGKKFYTISILAKPAQTAPGAPMEVKSSMGNVRRSRSTVDMQLQAVNKSQERS